jgi:hypothetical protein
MKNQTPQLSLLLLKGIADEQFKLYHEANPLIYEYFKKFTFRAINRRRKHLSAKAIFESIRWETSSRGNDGYKLNNNYHSYYARMFMNEFERYEGFFRLRKSKADKAFYK